MTRIVALVPMRHHSQRVPGKNYRLLGEKPLYHYILETLFEVPEISEVVVDTDSPIMVCGLREHFPTVKVIDRPDHLVADEIPMNEVLIHDTSQVEADFYLQTHSTNPLLKADTISNAIRSLLSNYPSYDSLFSVTRWQTRLWDQLGRAINHNPEILIQTQDLPPVFEENSCLYIFRRETLVRRRNRLGERPMMFEIKASEAWDIDEELDYEVTNFLLEKGLNL
jgi:CMP-N-acetylneuraminic acid synthetase